MKVGSWKRIDVTTYAMGVRSSGLGESPDFLGGSMSEVDTFLDVRETSSKVCPANSHSIPDIEIGDRDSFLVSSMSE